MRTTVAIGRSRERGNCWDRREFTAEHAPQRNMIKNMIPFRVTKETGKKAAKQISIEGGRETQRSKQFPHPTRKFTEF